MSTNSIRAHDHILWQFLVISGPHGAAMVLIYANMVLPGEQRGVFPEVFGAKQTLRESPSADSADNVLK